MPSLPLRHFAHAAAVVVGSGEVVVGEVEVPGAWAVEMVEVEMVEVEIAGEVEVAAIVEMVVIGEETGEEMMVVTVGEMGVTNMQTGGWGWWLGWGWR